MDYSALREVGTVLFSINSYIIIYVHFSLMRLIYFMYGREMK